MAFVKSHKILEKPAKTAAAPGNTAWCRLLGREGHI